MDMEGWQLSERFLEEPSIPAPPQCQFPHKESMLEESHNNDSLAYATNKHFYRCTTPGTRNVFEFGQVMEEK